ncbi:PLASMODESMATA CALLOSE-BINDING PROTEIN 2-like [Iris pallida]|uniref:PLASMODESMATA CALLOSE-BINDING PROTEIN 2-like n=1 Tax=Iris pallida TaxID=29817 RepID=A0AAX6GRY7_IRIPA|nr:PLASMODESMATA CALLOSE-BINDING PROTEIN 2-like [Iris pallida]
MEEQQQPWLIVVLVMVTAMAAIREVECQQQGQGQGQWCIARSGATAQALQSALDYACGRGIADCAPIQSSGLCYLPNTLQAHASYAFNSFFQRSSAAPGACDFGGTATVTITDPSYGSCTFPSSASTAGGSSTPIGGSTTPVGATTTPTTPISNTPVTPLTNAPPPPGVGLNTGGGIGGTGGAIGGVTPAGGSTGLNPGGFGPSVPNTDFSGASDIQLPLLLFTWCYFLPLLV